MEEKKKAPGLAKAAIVLSITSLAILVASIVLGVLNARGSIDIDFGVTSGLTPALFVAIAGATCGEFARKAIAKNNLPGKKMALTALFMGVAVVVLSVLVRIAVFVTFIPWLFAS